MAIILKREIKVFNKELNDYITIPYIDATQLLATAFTNIANNSDRGYYDLGAIDGVQNVKCVYKSLRQISNYKAYLPQNITPYPLSDLNLTSGSKKELFDVDFNIIKKGEVVGDFVATLRYNGYSNLEYAYGDKYFADALIGTFNSQSDMFNNINNLGVVFADIAVDNPRRNVFTMLIVKLSNNLICLPGNSTFFSSSYCGGYAFSPASIALYATGADANYPYASSNFSVRESKFNTDFGGESTPGGYSGGTYDNSSDEIGLPSMPSASVSTAGFVNIYTVSDNALSVLGRELFPPLPDFTDSVADVLYSIGTAFQNSTLINYVLDCHIIPVPPTVGDGTKIKVGYREIDTSVLSVTSDYVDFDCGTLEIGEYFGNFADYGAFTTCKLFLPFIGFVDLKPEYWQSGRLNVTYRFNVIDGSCMAYVKSSSSKSELANTVIAQYSGVACVHIPITGTNYSNMVSTAISGGSSVVTNAGSGNFAGAANDLMSLASLSPSVQSSNGYSSSSSIMSIRTPYLLIERPVHNFSNLYAHENGLPCNITVYFDELEGFTIATVEHLEGFENALPEEIEDIKRQLAQGVIF